MLQYRVGIFFGGATLAGAFSGLLAFGISFMSGTAGMLGWSWIFIIEGLATVVVGFISFFSAFTTCGFRCSHSGGADCGWGGQSWSTSRTRRSS